MTATEHIDLPSEGNVPSLAGATQWLHSPPLRTADLRGRVALFNVCTYSCINWLRSLPYVRAWDAKYREHGLVVIGVHSPEFAFERDVDSVARALKERRIEYPIAIDNDFAVWRAFANRYWPALYLADAQGQIRHHHFGEGGYERSERIIQQVLAAAGARDVDHELVSVDAGGDEAPADWDSLSSPETYVGYDRTESFASPGGVFPDERRSYTAPAPLTFNHWALAGDWTIGSEAAVSSEADGRIVFRFQARDLHLVMGPVDTGASVRFRVLVDGHPPGASHGIDVDDDGFGSASERRLFQLVRQRGAIDEHTVEIAFRDAGIAAYVFTFG